MYTVYTYGSGQPYICTCGSYETGTPKYLAPRANLMFIILKVCRQCWFHVLCGYICIARSTEMASARLPLSNVSCGVCMCDETAQQAGMDVDRCVCVCVCVCGGGGV